MSKQFRQLWELWKTATDSWRIYLEKPVPVEEVAYSREAASIPSFGFFFLLISATVIATLGLLSNSSAVIIGAMIVAPLMNPILSMSFAIVTANWKLYKRSIVTVFLGATTTILVSYAITALLPINIVGSEIVARTAPNLMDLGVAIAAGAAGSFSLTRLSIASSIAGVAIAVALVPPLCVAGIGLGIGPELAGEIGKVVVGNTSVSAGAFLLFLANLTGIVFAACIIFLSQSYGSLHKAFQTLLIWLFIMVLLCAPLTNSLKEFYISNRVDLEIHQLREDYPEISRRTRLRYVDVHLEGTTAHIRVLTNVSKDTLTDEFDEYVESAKKRIFDSLSKMGVTAMDLKIAINPVETREYTAIMGDL